MGEIPLGLHCCNNTDACDAVDDHHNDVQGVRKTADDDDDNRGSRAANHQAVSANQNATVNIPHKTPTEQPP